jgi:Protein of unknown function (DUF3107)
MVPMVQMLSMVPIAEGRGARVSGHDLPTAADFTRPRKPCCRPAFSTRQCGPLACLLKNGFQRLAGKKREGADVEVKIGITDSPRELVFSSAQTPGEVEELVNAALGATSNVLSLTDEKGRRFVVNAAKIAYVEIGVADARRVGFGLGSSAARNG